jgi:hypothetical protein
MLTKNTDTETFEGAFQKAFKRIFEIVQEGGEDYIETAYGTLYINENNKKNLKLAVFTRCYDFFPQYRNYPTKIIVSSLETFIINAITQEFSLIFGKNRMSDIGTITNKNLLDYYEDENYFSIPKDILFFDDFNSNDDTPSTDDSTEDR